MDFTKCYACNCINTDVIGYATQLAHSKETMRLFYPILLSLFSIHSFGQTMMTSKDSAAVKRFLPPNSELYKAFKVDLEGDGVMKQYLPPNSAINKEPKLDLKREDINEIVFSYTVTGPRDAEHLLILNDSDRFNSGYRVLKFSDSLGWTVVYEKKLLTGNEIGVWSAPLIEKIHNTSNRKEAVLEVAEYFPGTVSVTGWSLITSLNGKYFELDPFPIVKKVLASRNCCLDNVGYDAGVTTDGTNIVASQRCSHEVECHSGWDNEYDIQFKFTGNSIELDSVIDHVEKPH